MDRQANLNSLYIKNCMDVNKENNNKLKNVFGINPNETQKERKNDNISE